MKNRNILLKVISGLTVFIMIISSFGIGNLATVTNSLALAIGDTTNNTNSATSPLVIPDCIPQDAQNRSKHVKELPQYENNSTVAFQNNDGTKTFYVFQDPVKYQDDQGATHYFDDSIVSTQDASQIAKDRMYQTKDNDIKTYFPEDVVSNKSVRLEYQKPSLSNNSKQTASLPSQDPFYIELKPNVDLRQGYEFTYGYSYKAAAKYQQVLVQETDNKSKYDSVQYNSSFGDNVDLSFTPTNSGLEEEIIINKYTGQNTYEFALDTNGIPEQQDDGTIAIKDAKTGMILSTLDNDYAFDSYTGKRKENDGHDTSNIKTSITKNDSKDNEYILTISVDQSFLKNKKTVYPVVVDPQIVIYRLDANGQYAQSDAMVSSKNPSTNYNTATDYWVGYSTTEYYMCRTYVKFNFPSNFNPYDITSAVYQAREEYGYTSSAYVNIYRVLSNWDPTTINWNNKPSYGEQISSTLVNYNGAHNYYFPITQLVKNWLLGQSHGGYNNYGFVLKLSDSQEASHDYLRKFSSVNYTTHTTYDPYIEINYDDTDTVPPNQVSTPTLTATPGAINSGTSNLQVTWNETTDLPAIRSDGVQGYKIYLVTNGNTATQQLLADVPHLGTSLNLQRTYPDANNPNSNFTVSDQNTYKIGIVAYDASGTHNASNESYSNEITPADRTAPSIPTDPSFTISQNQWTSELDPQITWGHSTDKSDLTDIKWAPQDIDSEYQSVGTDSGSLVFPGARNNTYNSPTNLQIGSQLPDGSNTIYFRIYDRQGNYCKTTATYKKDTTAPTISINNLSADQVVNGIIPIYATINDSASGINNWKLEYGQGTNPTSFQTLTSGNTSQNNGVILNWNTGSLSENTGYTLRLTASDNATNRNGSANTSSTSVYVVKASNTTLATKALNVTSPNNNATITNPQMSVSFTPTDGLTNTNLVVDGAVVDSNSSDGLTADLSDANKYPEGSSHQFYIRAFNSSQNSYVYSSDSYKTTYSDTFSNTSQVEAQNNTVVNNGVTLAMDGTNYSSSGTILSNFNNSNIAGNISEVKLSVGESKPDGTDIAYQVSNDGGNTWQNATSGSVIAFNSPGSTIQVKATLSTTDTTVTPTLQWWQADIVYLSNGQQFTVSLVSAPQNLSSKGDINYSNLSIWTNSDSGYHSDTITYNIYRGNSSNFDIYGPQSTKLNTAPIPLGQTYWYDNALVYSTTEYYKVTAVKNIGTAQNPVYRESLPSNCDFATFVDQGELDKRIGIESFWKYAGFRTGSGNGYVNVSTGALTYQTTDFVYPTPFLAMAMTRTYNSNSTSSTALGVGWDFSYNTCLLYVQQDNTINNNSISDVILKDGDGSIHRFTRNADGTYSAPTGEFMQLTKNPDSTWTILRNDNIEYHFDANMHLTGFSEPNGNYLSVGCDGQGRISVVTSYVKDLNNPSNFINDGTMTFHYITYSANPNNDANITRRNALVGMLDYVQDPAGRTFYYDYDSNKRLTVHSTAIDNSQTYTEKFNYYSSSDQSNGKVKDIIDGNGNDTLISYDPTYGKVNNIKFPIRTETQTFSYPSGTGYSAGQTTVTDQNSYATTFTFDANGLVTKVTDPLTHETDFEYNGDWLVTRQYTYQTDNDKTNNNPVNWYYSYTDLVHTGSNSYHSYLARANIGTITDPYGNVTTYSNYNTFNEPGTVTVPVTASPAVTATTQYTYDNCGNCTVTIDPEGRKTQNDYYPGGMLEDTKEIYNNTTQNVTSYTYFGNNDSNGIYGWLKTKSQQLNSTTNATTTVLQYDAQGDPVITQDAMGVQTRADYDLLGRLVKTYLPKTTPDNDNIWTDHQFTETDYDMNSNVVRTVAADGIIQKFEYDAMDRLIKSGNWANNAYVNPSTISYGYDTQKNQTVTKTDPTNVVSIDTYNADGQLIKSQANGTYSTYQYDNVGNMTMVTDAEGHNSIAAYNKLNQKTQTTTDPSNICIVNNFTYDLLGDTLTSTDGMGNVTTNTYDRLGRLKTVSQSPDTDIVYTTQYTYDQLATITVNGVSVQCIKNTVTDAAGGVKNTYVDPLGRTVRDENLGTNTTNGVSMIEDYQYDLNGNEIWTKNNDNSYQTYAYNCRNQQTDEVFYPATGSITGNSNHNDYYPDGKLEATTALRHDTYVEGTQTYDSYSKEVTSYAYDSLDRISQDVQSFYQSGNGVFDHGVANCVNYLYDNANRVNQISYAVCTVPASGAISATLLMSADIYNYDSYGRLSQTLYDDNQSDTTPAKLVQDYSYDTDGRADDVIYYNNFKSGGDNYIEKYSSYDTANRVIDVQYDDNTDTNSWCVADDYFDYWKDNNIEDEDEFTMDANDYSILACNYYYYDGLGRMTLSDVEIDKGTDNNSITETDTDYEYDSVGNRTYMDNGTNTYKYSYDEFNKLLTVGKGATGQETTFTPYMSYTYDSLGRQTQEATLYKNSSNNYVNHDWTDQTYCISGEMFSNAQRDINNPNNSAEYYYYDADGKRVRKFNDTDSTNYYYTGGALLYTTTSDINTKITENIVTPSGDIVASQRFSGTYANNWYTYCTDVRGSVLAIVAPDGSLTKDYTYDPFGTSTASGDSNFSNEVTFTGAIQDSSGVYNMNARYYNPKAGRFLTQDSYSGNAYEPMTQNLYTYCGNNPVSMVDPTGHMQTEWANGICKSSEDTQEYPKYVVPDKDKPKSSSKKLIGADISYEDDSPEGGNDLAPIAFFITPTVGQYQFQTKSIYANDGTLNGYCVIKNDGIEFGDEGFGKNIGLTFNNEGEAGYTFSDTNGDTTTTYEITHNNANFTDNFKITTMQATSSGTGQAFYKNYSWSSFMTIGGAVVLAGTIVVACCAPEILIAIGAVAATGTVVTGNLQGEGAW